MPKKIGKYRIVEQIGRGDTGTIWKAHDAVLDRLVALKVISADVDITDALRARFFREAQAAAQLSHPNIVTVYAMGDDDGQIFIVMELLEGEELKHLIADRRQLPLEDKLSVMIQVCDGLQYAHEKGIVHRDVKPGNIFILERGLVKILDFGMAHMANADGRLTRTGLRVGNLRYISPEQVRGEADHRSDIFSVGAVLYEFLSLRPPFASDDPLQLLEQLRAEDPPRLDQLDPAVPSALASAVARAMRKDPAERFPDLGALRAELELVQREVIELERRRRREAAARAAEDTIAVTAPAVRSRAMSADSLDITRPLASPAGADEPAAAVDPRPTEDDARQASEPVAARAGGVPAKRWSTKRLATAALAGVAAAGLLFVWLPRQPSPDTDRAPDAAPPPAAIAPTQEPAELSAGRPDSPTSPTPARVSTPSPSAAPPSAETATSPPATVPPATSAPPASAPAPSAPSRSAGSAAVSPSTAPSTVPPRAAAPRVADAPLTPRRPTAATAPPVVRPTASTRCSDILERASLGEPLTDEEQTTLTRDCR